MTSILVNVVGPVFLVALVGYIWSTLKRPFDAAFIAELTILIGTPFLIIDTLAQAHLSAATLGAIVVAAAACHAIPMAIGWLALQATRQPIDVFLPSLVFANTGNMGLPLTLFAFGQEGLALAVAYFAVGTLINFTIGEWISAGRFSLTDAFRTPLLWATIIGMGLSVSGLTIPTLPARAIHILGSLTVPLMLLSLGVSLARLAITSLGRSIVLALARLALGFATGWLVAWLLGLDGVARGVVVTQSAMPAAVINYMFALRYGKRPEEVAGIIVLSSLIAVIALPFVLATVMP